MEVGHGTLLQLVDKFVVDDLEFDFLCLFLLLIFKPYFIMSSKVITEDMLKSSDSVENPIISVVISNYPLSNGGYLVSFSQVEPDGSFKSYDLAFSLDFEASKFSAYLDSSSVFLPKGCYYLYDRELAGFIKALSFGASTFEMKLLPASGQIQGMILVQVDEKSLSKYEQEEED